MGHSKAPLRLRGLLACGFCALSAGMIVPSASAAGPPALVSGQAPGTRWGPVQPEPEVAAPEVGPPSLADRLQGAAAQDTLAPNTIGISVDMHGTVLYVRTTGPSLATALAGLGIIAAPDERVLPADDAVLAEGLAIRLRRVRTNSTTTTAVIPRPVREVLDPGLDAGTTALDSDGQDGVSVTVTESTFEDDQPVSVRTVSDTVASAPVERVVRRGVRAKPAEPAPEQVPAPTGIQASFSMPSRNVTAYCLTGRTATGTMAGPGSIAVDPSVIKLGSHLYVPGYGSGWATDTGGGVHGDAVDLWMTCPDAIRWGRRAVTVYVLST